MCGDLYFDHPEANFKFPTSLPSSSFKGIGEPLDIGGAILTLLKVERIDRISSGGNHLVQVSYRLENASKGYPVDKSYYPIYTIGSDGIYTEEGIKYMMHAGPGQVVEGVFNSTYSSVKDNVLVLEEERPDITCRVGCEIKGPTKYAMFWIGDIP